MGIAPAATISAATTFSGTPTVAQLAANSFATIANSSDLATFTAELSTSAFVGTLTFYGLEVDGSTLVPILGHQRNSSTIANNTAINTAVALNQVWVGSIASFAAFYVVCTAFTSGSVTVQPGLSAGLYMINIGNVNANGQALSSASAPVVVASDQSPIATKRTASTLYTTTQTGISATGNSGDITTVGPYSELLVMVNLTAFTGTNINFRIRGKDAFGNYYTLGSTGVQTGVGSFAFGVGQGAGNNIGFGDIVILEWLCTSVTSATFTATMKAK